MAYVTGSYRGPKSICKCGHEGDGLGSDHAGLVGHGHCVVENCTCQKFTWKSWTPAFKKIADAIQRAD